MSTIGLLANETIRISGYEDISYRLRDRIIDAARSIDIHIGVVIAGLRLLFVII